MITSKNPYSECCDPFEFFMKLKSGEKPAALARVNDPETREFVEKCLSPVSLRLSAKELLNDPFLRNSEVKSDFRLLYSRKADDTFGIPVNQHQLLDLHDKSLGDSYGGRDFWGDYEDLEDGSDDFEYHDHQRLVNIDVSIKAKWMNGLTYLRLEAADGMNRVQKDYPCGLEIERASSVETELLAELEGTDEDGTKTADMIKAAISFMESGRITKPAKYTQKQFQRLENRNHERNNVVGARPSERNVMIRRKPRDTLTNNPLGIKASVWSILEEKLPVSKQLTSSLSGINPSIC